MTDQGFVHLTYTRLMRITPMMSMGMTMFVIMIVTMVVVVVMAMRMSLAANSTAECQRSH
jgi:hypothetical protein